MNTLSIIRKHLTLLGIISVIYFVYVTILIRPWSFRHFSLVDDGQVLIQSSSYLEDCLLHFKCSRFVDQTFEFGTSRFRPSYWLINNFLYEVFGNNASAHHVFRAYIIGYLLVFMLTILLLDLKVSGLFVFAAFLIFSTNYSFSENIIRLGTNEPYQVLFLALFSFFYLKKEELGKDLKFYSLLLIGLLTWAILVKENDIAILPAILLTETILNKWKITKKVVILVGVPTLVFVLGTFVTKFMPSVISPEIPAYTSNYVTNPVIIIDNLVANIRLLLNSTSPFLELTLAIFPLLYASEKIRNSLKERKFYYWIFFSAFFTGILFPWRYVMERYQLVAIFGLTIIIAFLLNQAFFLIKGNLLPQKITTGFMGKVFYLVSFVLIMNLFFRGFPVNLAKTINYREWFLTFTSFEADQIGAIAKYNNEKVYINGLGNINNWELLYEVPIHLKFLYGLKPNVKILEGDFPKKGYIFSRSSFDSYVKMGELEKSGYELVDWKSYSIDQTDPIKFRKSFIQRPIQTILTPPFSENKFEYYWEIRTLKI